VGRARQDEPKKFVLEVCVRSFDLRKTHLNISRARETYLKWTTSYISSNTPADLLVVGIAINFLLITDKDLSVTAKREPARVLSVRKQSAREQGRMDVLRWNSLAGESADEALSWYVGDSPHLSTSKFSENGQTSEMAKTVGSYSSRDEIGIAIDWVTERSRLPSRRTRLNVQSGPPQSHKRKQVGKVGRVQSGWPENATEGTGSRNALDGRHQDLQCCVIRPNSMEYGRIGRNERQKRARSELRLYSSRFFRQPHGYLCRQRPIKPLRALQTFPGHPQKTKFVDF